MTAATTQTNALCRAGTNAPEILLFSNPTNPVVPTNFFVRGSPIPPNVPHAIAGSVPTWKDVCEYMAREPGIMGVMKSGYPRFFIHRSILKV